MLRPWQAAFLPLLDWLLDPDIRRTGKSTLLAIAFVRAAAKRPGQWVRCYDHVDMVTCAESVMRSALGFIAEDPRLSPHLEVRASGMRRDQFRLNLATPISNWLPSGLLSRGYVAPPPIPNFRDLPKTTNMQLSPSQFRSLAEMMNRNETELREAEEYWGVETENLPNTED